MNDAKKIHGWALGITIFIVLFLITMIGLTIFVSQQEYHLVTENYYEKDLGFQNEIDTRQRTRERDQLPVVQLDREAKVCILSFPPRASYEDITGEVTFFRISDARSDEVRTLRLNDEGRQHISVSGLQTGQWILKLQWKEDGQDYYLEQRLYLQ
jgi:hypothetical protein